MLDRLVEEIFKRMESSGGWGHMPVKLEREEIEGTYGELHAVGQWMLAAAGACERLGCKLPPDRLKLALKFVQDCCTPGQGAVGYNNKKLVGELYLKEPGMACPGRTGGAIFGFALLKQQRNPLYPQMVFAWTADDAFGQTFKVCPTSVPPCPLRRAQAADPKCSVSLRSARL